MKIWLPAIQAGTGTDVFTERLAVALRTRGIEATITWFPRWMEFLPALMKRTSPPPGTTIIHGNGWTVAPFVGGDLPVVNTVHHLVHDPAFARYRSRAQAVYHALHVRPRDARAIRQAQAVTAVSDYVAGTVRALFGREDVRTIGNWIDTDLYRPDPAFDATSTPSRSLRLLWVGNPSRRKGFDLVPRLAGLLAGNGVTIRCVGGLRGDRVAVPASDGIQWLGRLSEAELVSEYQACDLVVSLSRYEGFGYSALEAMACGKPVVAFAAGGLADVVEHGVTGLLAPVDDLDALAANVIQLAGDPARRHEMGLAGREFACREANRVDDYVALYRELTSRHRAEAQG